MNDFDRLPVADQLHHLEARLDDDTPLELLALCASARDHTPLAWLSARLLERGWLAAREHQQVFAQMLLSLPDTAVQKVVREMLDVGQTPDLRDTLLLALRTCPLEKLTSSCILDRVLKHNFPHARDEFVHEMTQTVLDALRAGDVDAIDAGMLVAFPGSALREADDAATAGGVAPQMRDQRRQTAMQAVDVLGDAPKAVSQANAEELLATRVYTDPGHFLIELLQNAEDAGATRWRVSFEPTRVVVWHDGVPFDFRDVVGVTSIGQTTKRKSQIGFFGVGFKSVYEITNRPQVYSDVFDFEIVDVSIPRWIGRRPADVPAEGTVLVLPLRDPKDAARSPARLYEKARQLDPCVLFTLAGIDEIELQLHADCEAGPQHWKLREREPDELGRSVIDVLPAQERLHYLVRSGRYEYDGGAREVGRPDATVVMVGVRLDAEGVPRPLDDSAPNIYSYLPTDERAGLRFFVQGHFDVPVDRERIAPESSWNRWVLQKVPTQLAHIARQLTERRDHAMAAARGLLDVLPLERELNTPIFRVIPRGLAGALVDVPIVPCTDREPHPAREVMIAAPEVATLLEGVKIDATWLTGAHHRRGAPWRYLMVPDLPVRSIDVALQLGASNFEYGDLVDVVIAILTSDDETLPLRDARHGDLDDVARMYEVLMQSVEHLESDRGRLGALAMIHKLRDVPLIACTDGELRRSKDTSRAARAIRDVYDRERAFVAEAFDRTLASDTDREERSGRVDTFLDRLGVRVHTLDGVLADVERDPAPFVADDARRRGLIELFGGAVATLQVRAAQLPLFRGTDGKLYRAATARDDRDGLLIAAPGPVGDALRRLIDSGRPVADESHPAAIELLRRAKTPELDMVTLLAAVAENPTAFDALSLHTALDSIRDHLSEVDRRKLAEAPIWPDRHGELSVLRGEESKRAIIAGDSELPTLLPEQRFVAEQVTALPYVGDIAPPAGTDWLVLHLTTLPVDAPLFADPERLRRVVEFLGHRIERLPTQTVSRIATLPIFGARTDAGPQQLPLGAWGHDARPDSALLCTPDVAGVLRAAGLAVVDSETDIALRGFERAGAVVRVDFEALLSAFTHLDTVAPHDTRPPIQKPAALAALHRELEPRLEDTSSGVLADLSIIATVGGGVARIGELLVSEALPIFAPDTEAHAQIAAVTGDSSAAGFIEALRRRRVELSAGGNAVLRLLDVGTTAVGDHPHLQHASRRSALYVWLDLVLDRLVVEPECRELLATTPLFPTRDGELVPLPALVVDADLPDLGIDCTPSREIPTSLLDRLRRLLGLDQLDFAQLYRLHIEAAMRRAAAARDVAAAASLALYVAQHTTGLSDKRLRTLLGDQFLVATPDGSWLPAPRIVIPTDETAISLARVWGDGVPTPHSAYDAEVAPLLRRLGARQRPDAQMLLDALTRTGSVEASSAAAQLLDGLWHDGEVTDEQLRHVAGEAWVADARGEQRRPGDLFARSTEVETVAGDFDDLYAHAEVNRHLGDELAARVGFKTDRDVPLELVVRNLRHRSARGEPVRLSLYIWLDRGIAQGWLDPQALKRLLGDAAWIFTDDEEWFHHEKVLGARELQLFGPRRGYWTHGPIDCPSLCEAFTIRSEVTSNDVVALLREVAREASRTGDRQLLEADPALPRMLLNCYAFLGDNDAVPTGSLPILCRERSAEAAPALRLRPSSTKSLFRSDTPTLEAMFERVGTLQVASQGPAERSASIDTFYERAGVRRLREAYEVKVASDAGADRTQQHQGQIQTLRGWFRSLLGVLPRIQQQRGGSDEAWRYREALSELVERCAIRAVDDLRVVFEIADVGQVVESVPAAYNPEARELLVDTTHIVEPHADPTGLALGLMPVIYDGPGEDQVTDIIVILLPLRTRERMDAYLDHRHFPVATKARSPADRVAGRLQEVLDFGLARRLALAYPQLRGVSLDRWRDAEVAARALSSDGVVTPYGVTMLFDAVGIAEPDGELVDAMIAVLDAPSIDDVPPSVFGQTQPEPAAATPRDPSPSSTPLPRLTDTPRQRFPVSPTVSAGEWSQLPQIEDAPEMAIEDLDDELALPRPVPKPTGVVASIKRFVGWGDDHLVEPTPLPAWTQAETNSFDNVAGIPPQLWVTPDRLDRIATSPVATSLRFVPGNLPRPYLYAIRAGGGQLDPRTQRWQPLEPRDMPQLATGSPTGQLVEFAGTLGPALTQLPIPLHARLTQPPIVDGSPVRLLRRTDGSIWAQLPRRVELSYVVELLDPPVLTDDEDPIGWDSPRLQKPTTARRAMPAEVQRFLATLPTDAPMWERALAVEAFVRARYAYDANFMAHHAVQRAAAQLPGESTNHHLTLLHASADDQVLGRGICYELNVLIVELLRHADIPAFPSSGWVLDRGVAERPDHLFALAIVPSLSGPTLLPLEGACTESGEPIRPMATRPPPTHAPSIATPGGAWNPNSTTSAHPEGGLERLRIAGRHQLLVEAIHYLRGEGSAVEGAHVAQLSAEPTEEACRELTAIGIELLGSAELFAALMSVLCEPELDGRALSPELHELVDRGLITIRTVPRYRITRTR